MYVKSRKVHVSHLNQELQLLSKVKVFAGFILTSNAYLRWGKVYGVILQ